MKRSALKIVSVILVLMFALLALASCIGEAETKTATEVLKTALGQSFSSELKKGSVQIIANDLPVGPVVGSFDVKGYFDGEKKALALIGSAVLEKDEETLEIDVSEFVDAEKGVAVKSEALLGNTVIGIPAKNNEAAMNALKDMFGIDEEDLDSLSEMWSSTLSSSTTGFDATQKISSAVISAVVNALNKNDALTMTEANGKIAISATYNTAATADILTDVIAELETNKDLDNMLNQVFNPTVATGENLKTEFWSKLKELAPMIEESGDLKSISLKFVVDAGRSVIEDFELNIQAEENVKLTYSNKNGKMSLKATAAGMTIELSSEYKEENGKNKFDMSLKMNDQELGSLSWVQDRATGKFTVGVEYSAGFSTFSATLEGTLKINATTFDLALNKVSYSTGSFGEVEQGTFEFDVRIIIRTDEDVPAFPSFTSFEDVTTTTISEIMENVEKISAFFGMTGEPDFSDTDVSQPAN